VLVVDDEAIVFDSLCTYLRQLGWAARGVASGNEAAQALADGLVVDALMLDFRLRDGTGGDIIARLRSSRPGLAALIVTADTAPHRLSELEGRGIGCCTSRSMAAGWRAHSSSRRPAPSLLAQLRAATPLTHCRLWD
jgi:CheY-like chemotaxis protein